MGVCGHHGNQHSVVLAVGVAVSEEQNLADQPWRRDLLDRPLCTGGELVPNDDDLGVVTHSRTTSLSNTSCSYTLLLDRAEVVELLLQPVAGQKVRHKHGDDPASASTSTHAGVLPGIPVHGISYAASRQSGTFFLHG